MPYEPPTHTVERSLRATTGAKIIAGVDEVGRGAWAGPVTVCAAVTGLRRAPRGPHRLQAAQPQAPDGTRRTSAGVGHGLRPGARVPPGDRRARHDRGAASRGGQRALEALPVRPDAVILDGKHDYLGSPWKVRTVIKGDQSCVAVAAASVIAKVQRDTMMAELGADGSRRLRLRRQRRLSVAGAPGRAGGAGAHPAPPPLLGLPRRAAQVAAPEEGPAARRGGGTGKRGPTRLRFLTRAHGHPPTRVAPALIDINSCLSSPRSLRFTRAPRVPASLRPRPHRADPPSRTRSAFRGHTASRKPGPAAPRRPAARARARGRGSPRRGKPAVAARRSCPPRTAP